MRIGKGRTKEIFDDRWSFHKGDIRIPYAVKAGMTGGITDASIRKDGEWLDIAFNDKGMGEQQLDWSAVSLPHDWCVEQQYVQDEHLGARDGSHGYLPGGIGFYRKVFELPAEAAGSKWLIRFDGVSGTSTVWVNGHLIGSHHGGYIGFSYDLSDVLRYGDEGRNVIVVKVDATECEGWWYEGCGIYRHVWLENMDLLHVAEYGTYITTPEVAKDQATVNIRTIIRNNYTEGLQVSLQTVIYDGSGLQVCARSADTYAEWLSETELAQSFQVEQPILWGPDSPYLYKAVSIVLHEGRELDLYETVFGIRSIRFDAQEGFFLNGEPLLIKGTCNHQDFAGVGVALPDSLIEYKLKLLQEMGSNAYRSAHHPPTPELLDICDRIGMLVMDENRKLDSSPNGISQLERLLYRDRNHPSVIIWSMENEEVLEGTLTGARILKTLADTTRRIDPTRPTCAAMNHGWNENGYNDVVEITGYNYGHRDHLDIRDHEQYPGRLMIGSECASYTATRGIYEDDPIRAYCSEYGTNIPSWGCTPQQAWTDLVNNRFLTGVFMWTGFDYRGEPTPYLWPCINSHFGLMDTCGFPKDSYYYMKAVWTEEPMVHLLPHWNWQGSEGKAVEVRVFSNTDTVELYLNGRSLGEQQANRNGYLTWKVIYEPGQLEAVGKQGGQGVVRKSVVTAGQPHQIQLIPDRHKARADGTDTIPVRVAVLDKDGNIVPTADNEIRFEVSGAGSLLGIGNGNPSSHEPDKSSRRCAFNGWCLALVQTSSRGGAITLSAVSDGLAAAELNLQAVSGDDTQI
ncbi:MULTISPECIES: beta-galactosidase GalA [unclassified Paenibacillus]|uniref:beta-galactosidase GalA n=1 Tax=unclassified Paenibacillus TaxID=185978 RepID=UPI002404C587|nr:MULTISPECIES: beta-galactosidase GalA [unclassified Paenibacillus]MDF9842628.1 beta-galactosidase [Paenibacillus sp. PastF-2]MDF9849165.1 beta-galactosidase [Paenibacillus sp. PastM-2]MDF9855789.1 beta-galactosidase [Paenibacillus sp. PastF-1]MDH6481007.1 beta-galactosidase [Paenibacillus sp. PastH-2]MDH6508480.1 beta-galactosidase [Paenibacillus sp. PastM-3]